MEHPPTLPELKLQDGDLFGASLVCPGYRTERTTWTLTIHKHGLLTQTVLLCQPPTFDKQLAVLRQHVGKDQLDHLKQIVEDESLLTLTEMPYPMSTDLEETRLIIRLFGRANTIEAYGAEDVAASGESERDRTVAKGYCRLWNAISDLGPFEPYSHRA